MTEGLRALARRQHGAFSVRQAMQWYSARRIRSQVRAGHWIRIFSKVLCEANERPSPATLLAGAGLAVGAPVIACLHTAASLHGFGVVPASRVHVVDPKRHLHKRNLLMFHQLEVPSGEIVQVEGLLATAPARTAVELARQVDRFRALAVLDAALRTGGVTADDLVLQCERQAGRRGIAIVRELVPMADLRAESPMESALRLVCHRAGLPPPVPQFAVLDESGREVRRLDLAWPRHKVAVEYDGVESHTGAQALRRDRARHNFLVERGWIVIHATAEDVHRHPERLVRRIALALRRRSAGVDHELW